MKLYLFDTINRFKRYSETLDIKTKICNRPWIVFNDGGEKEVYKFKEDGTINIVLSGRVTRGTWEYDPTDKTIIISASDQSYMVHPGMYDDMLLALQVDGTNECSFLIEENNSKNFSPKTYSELMLFFAEKEKKALEEEKRIRLLKEEEERELEKIQRQNELNKIIAEFDVFLKQKHYHEKHEVLVVFSGFILLFILLSGIIFGGFYLIELYPEKNDLLGVIIMICSVTIFLFGTYLLDKYYRYSTSDYISRKLVKEFFDLHQNNKINLSHGLVFELQHYIMSKYIYYTSLWDLLLHPSSK